VDIVVTAKIGLLHSTYQIKRVGSIPFLTRNIYKWIAEMMVPHYQARLGRITNTETSRTMNIQLDLTHTDTERIEEFKRRLAAALKRILAERSPGIRAAGDEQSG
jgi:hypothetical protein